MIHSSLSSSFFSFLWVQHRSGSNPRTIKSSSAKQTSTSESTTIPRLQHTAHPQRPGHLQREIAIYPSHSPWTCRVRGVCVRSACVYFALSGVARMGGGWDYVRTQHDGTVGCGGVVWCGCNSAPVPAIRAVLIVLGRGRGLALDLISRCVVYSFVCCSFSACIRCAVYCTAVVSLWRFEAVVVLFMVLHKVSGLCVRSFIVHS